MVIDLDYVSIANPEIDTGIFEPRLANKTFTCEITYPLSRPYIFMYKFDPKGSLDGLIEEVCKNYKSIYDLEDKTSELEATNIPGMYNRVQTNGTYGIWGHDIGDLALGGLYIDTKLNKIRLGVDS